MTDNRNLPSTTSRARPSASGEISTRLFQRLHTAYGKHWLDMWADAPMDRVKATWGDALAQFRPDEIAQALEHLPKFPPTLPEFVDLCRQFRKPGKPALAIVDGRRSPPPGGFQALRDVLRKATPKA